VIRRGAVTSPSPRSGTANAVEITFLDEGKWSLTTQHGPHYVVIDGPAFADEAPWIYEGHDTFEDAAIAASETATLLIPREVVAVWRERIGKLPADGVIGSTSPEIRDALTALMDLTLENRDLTLTVRSLL